MDGVMVGISLENYMLVILFMILIKYCHTRSIYIDNKPECFSERLGDPYTLTWEQD